MQEVPCDAPIRGAAALVRLHGRWRPPTPPPPDPKNASSGKCAIRRRCLWILASQEGEGGGWIGWGAGGLEWDGYQTEGVSLGAAGRLMGLCVSWDF